MAGARRADQQARTAGDDRLDEEETEYLDRALDLHVEVWTSQKEGAAVETDELLASLERDVLLVMLNNRQWSGQALDTELVGSFPFEEERTMPMCGLVIMFRLRYRISNVNPDTGP